MSRAVVQDSLGRLFLLEKFSSDKFEIRAQVARTQAYLRRNGLVSVLGPEPVCPDSVAKSQTLPERGNQTFSANRVRENLPFEGESLSEATFLAQWGGAFFQVTQFLANTTELPRPGWIDSGPTGRSMAQFLFDMHQAAAGIETQIPFSAFSIKTYIYKLFEDMQMHHPGFYSKFFPVRQFLEKEFMDAHDRLPFVFCHGDFHPLNVIWGDQKIMAVIDWEFTGMKPDCYDAANLIGCAGIEHPEGLAKPMVLEFLTCLRETDIVSPWGWRWLPEFVLALRFAWLCEWLRKQDTQMLETEAAYMEILIRHMEDLRDIWGVKK